MFESAVEVAKFEAAKVEAARAEAARAEAARAMAARVEAARIASIEAGAEAARLRNAQRAPPKRLTGIVSAHDLKWLLS